jgi:probable HAF family extracellular repeat protein
MNRTTFVAAGVLGLGALLGRFGMAEAAVPQGQAVLIELPPDSLAQDVGANGFVVVGAFFSGGALTWMPTMGSQPIGGLQAVAVSRDGKTIVGESFNAGRLEASIWQGGITWRPLGSIAPNAQPCDLNFSSSYDTNDDGSVVVGLAWNGCNVARAFRWHESTGMVDLGSLTGESTRANGVSGNGRVVVGWEEDRTGPRLGAKWVDGKQEFIKTPNGGSVGEAFGTNGDGSLIVGTNCDFFSTVPGPPTGFTWTAKDGVKCFPVDRPRGLPPLPYSVLMQETSADGRVIGGAYSFGLDSESLVWFDGEVFFLKDYLRANGVPDAFEGWINTGFVTGVSSDGRTLVGYGAGPRTFQGFVVILPELGSK